MPAPVSLTRWLIDGMNLIGSRADGWWRDRKGAMSSLVTELVALRASTGEEVAVVFDGAPRAGVAEAGKGRIEVAFAPGAPDAADDEIVERVAAEGATGDLVVVTSDRRLADRVEEHGARVMKVSAFERVLDSAHAPVRGSDDG